MKITGTYFLIKVKKNKKSIAYFFLCNIIVLYILLQWRMNNGR